MGSSGAGGGWSWPHPALLCFCQATEQPREWSARVRASPRWYRPKFDQEIDPDACRRFASTTAPLILCASPHCASLVRLVHPVHTVFLRSCSFSFSPTDQFSLSSSSPPTTDHRLPPSILATYASLLRLNLRHSTLWVRQSLQHHLPRHGALQCAQHKYHRS